MAFKGISQDNYLPGQLTPAHFFGAAPFGATEEQIVHIPPGRGRRTLVPDYPQKGPTKRPEDGALGLHKTPIYNTLAKAGQTATLSENAPAPYRVGYCTETRMQSDGNMPQSFRVDRFWLVGGP